MNRRNPFRRATSVFEYLSPFIRMDNMPAPVALLGIENSPLPERLAGLLAQEGVPTRLLNLDAPLAGEPVTVRGAEVVWQECALHTAAVLWLERPVFPWPQMLPAPCPLPDVENFNRWRAYQREAQALAVAALAAAAEQVPVVNPPSSAHLAVAPTVALDRLTAAGLPLVPWRVGPARDSDVVSVGILDATGHDRWHPAGALPPDAPRLSFDDDDGTVTELLVVGGKIVGTRQWPDTANWAASDPTTTATVAPAPLTGLALRAATALALEVVQIACRNDSAQAAVLLAEAAPDLTTWDTHLDGAASTALARRLVVLAGTAQGDTP